MQTIALHHILLKSPLLAQDLVKELELGADFAELAREYSACPSGQNGGFAGYHHQDTLPDDIIRALATSQEQQSFIGPVESQYGHHLLKPVGEKPTGILDDPKIHDQSADEQHDTTDFSPSSQEPLSREEQLSKEEQSREQPDEH